MDITVFPANELPIALGAIRAVEPDARPEHDQLIEAIARLHGATINPYLLPSPTPAETAAVIVDPHRRKRLVQLAMVMTMVDGNVDVEPARAVMTLAHALDIPERAVRTLQRIATRHDLLVRLDVTRRIGGKILGRAWRERQFGGIVENAELARRYNRLGLLAEGSFGRALWEHWVSNDFGMPGQKHGLPELAVFHDVGHVLSGYSTRPEGEIQQAAFQAGFVRDDGFMFLFFGIAQFHLGHKLTPIADAYVGKLDVDAVMTALARGAACKVDISDGWSFWPHVERPLAEVRAELGVTPLAA